MAKIQWINTDVEGFSGNLELTSSNNNKAVFTDDPSGARIVMTGEGIKKQGGEITGGTIEKLVFEGSDGDNAVVVTGGKYKAAVLHDAAVVGNVAGVYESLFNGNDTVIGSGANDSLVGGRGDDEIFGRGGLDTLVGGRGDDELTGGNGVDYFVFYPSEDGAGKDIIRDLDISGPQVDQLYIGGDVLAVKKASGGDDTILQFESGGTILLKDVEKADFLDYWMS
jgi:Ca2+-binding RTX toxin-like protein